MEWQVTGNHAGSKRSEKAAITRLLHSGYRFLLPIHDIPAVIEGGDIVGRVPEGVPGPVLDRLPPRAWFPV
jgi:hypothetical protein